MLTTLERWALILNLITLPVIFLLGLQWFTYPLFFAPFLCLFIVALALSIIVDWRLLFRIHSPLQWMFARSFESALLIAAPPLVFQDFRWLILLLTRQAIFTVRLLLRWRFGIRFIANLLQQPAKLMVISFATLILLGAFLLMLPASTTAKTPLPFLDALFTSTSATCVTGLVVKDTPQDFTTLGQLIILCLIQIGGLGIMTLSSFIIWTTGRRLGLLSQHALGEILDEPTPDRVLRLLRFIVFSSLITEAIGALILYIRWRDPALHIPTPAFHAVFHSISAFCNAGFALWSNSLIPFQTDIVVNVTIIMLIILGGLGFPVLASLSDRKRWRLFQARRKRHPFLWSVRLYIQNLPLNTKIVLLAQVILFSTAAVFFFGLEYGHSLNHLSIPDKVIGALFQAVTLRTAGFNTLDYSLLTQATLLMMIFFMFIGGASGGTAGGLKVNTFAVLYLSLSSILRGRKEVEVFGRALPQSNIIRATSIISIFIALYLLACFVLLVTHPKIPFSHVMFEVTSALGTVGLTVATPDGVATTSKLNVLGKILITLLMFLGRLGPLTLASAISDKPSEGFYRYPRERIYVG